MVERTRVFVSGATGNVGRHLIKAVLDASDLHLVGGWSRRAGLDPGDLAGVRHLGLSTGSDLAKALQAAHAQVVVDFTAPSVAMDNLRTYHDLGLDAVVGTTGFTNDRMQQARQWAREKNLRWAIIANFGLSMNLAVEFMKSARKHFPYVTIIEKNYADKADAPSGTSLWLAAALAGEPGPTASKELLPGALGAESHGVRIHSIRVPTPGSHSQHEVQMARKDEALTVTVTDYSSGVYNDTVLLTVRKLGLLAPGEVITSLAELPGGMLP